MDLNIVEDRIKFAGKLLTVEELAQYFFNSNIDEALIQLEILIDQGRASIVKPAQDKGAIEIEKAEKQQAFYEEVEGYYQEEAQEKAFRLQQKRKDKLTYKAVDFDFPTHTKAREFQAQAEALQLETRILLNEDDTLTLQVLNITEGDLNKLQMLYKADRVVKSTLNLVETGAHRATEVVDYTASHVIVPVVTVGAKTSMGVLKTLTKTGAKTASTLLTSLNRGVRQTAHELKHDQDLAKAKAELLSVKDGIMKTVHQHRGLTGKGITIHQD